MQLNEIPGGNKITLNVKSNIEDKFVKLETTVLETIEANDKEYLDNLYLDREGIFVLYVEMIYHGDAFVTFENTNVTVNVIASSELSRPTYFRDVTVKNEVLPSGKKIYVIETYTEGREFNRRESFRVDLNAHGVISHGDNQGTDSVVVKDLSQTGVAIITTIPGNYDIGQKFKLVFYASTIGMYGQKEENQYSIAITIVRTRDLGEGRTLLGCTLDRTPDEITKLVIKKQSEKSGRIKEEQKAAEEAAEAGKSDNQASETAE